jgi:hypothetical protein
LKVELAAPDCGEGEWSSNCSVGSHDLIVIKPNLPKRASQILENIFTFLAIWSADSQVRSF